MVNKKKDIGDLVKSYLQRPYYWSWGGSTSSNVTNRWPKKEDKLRGKTGSSATATTTTATTGRPPKPVKTMMLNATTGYGGFETTSQSIRDSGLFAEDTFGGQFRRKSLTTSGRLMFSDITNALSIRSTTGDYQIDRKQPKWNFNFSIGDSNEVNTARTNEVYLHNKTVILITGNTLLPKLFNETIDYGGYNAGANWSNGTIDYDANYTSSIFGNYDVVHLAAIISTAIILGLIILATVIGNVFVIAAILLEKNLQNVANYLILSLAVADLLVACLVMPLGAVYEVSKQWTLGPELCDMWTSSDVLCCTASILHLVAIALDRYWAVTNIDYIHQRTAKRIGFMILVIWGVAFLVCIAPMLGWKDPEWEDRIFKNQTCLVSQDIGYQIFATASSFYVPLFVILVLYWRIFQTARKRIRRRGNQSAVGGVQLKNPSSGGVIAGAAGGSGGMAAAVVAVIGRPLPTISETTTAFTTVSSTNTSPEKQPVGNGVEPDLPTTDYMSSYQQTVPYPIPIKTRVREAADSKRERKAAKTLAIITGAFVMCWLPFFILAILLPSCKTCEFNPYMISFFLWLGYFNSTLNPIIYTIFSPEFRHAFKRLLCGHRGSIRRRNVRHFGPRHIQ